MRSKSWIAAACLMASGFVVAHALAQGAPSKAAAAQRLQKLKAQQDAALAAAKAKQNQINRPAPTPSPTPTPPPPPTTPPVTTRTTPTATATPTTTATTTASAKATPSASTSAKPAPSGSAASAAPSASASAKPAPLGLDLEELKKTRDSRRSGEVAQLKARWGELLQNPQAVAELRLHAQRTAYLQRIRALADQAKDRKTVEAVDILITKEEGRDADAMNALRSGALPGGGAK